MLRLRLSSAAVSSLWTNVFKTCGSAGVLRSVWRAQVCGFTCFSHWFFGRSQLYSIGKQFVRALLPLVYPRRFEEVLIC